jgi:hypothetical protein
MSLTQMAPGGQWFTPPTADRIPVYVPAKQLEAHRKRLIAEDGWTPIADPRREEDQPVQQQPAQINSTEIAMQARIDQLEAMIGQLLAQKAEPNDSQKHDVSADSENAVDDKRSRRGKSAL